MDKLINTIQWQCIAAQLIKIELKKKRINYKDLCIKLKNIGVNDTYSSIASKVNRGSFSFVFFLQCMRVLDRNEFQIPANFQEYI